MAAKKMMKKKNSSNKKKKASPQQMHEKKFLENSDRLLQLAHERLVIGEIYSYMEICRLLEIRELLNETKFEGYHKDRHMKQFSRLFDYDEVEKKGKRGRGKGIQIMDIYDEVKPKQTITKSQFANYLQFLLLNDLNYTPGNSAEYTMRQWWQKLRMVNMNYLGLMSNSYYKNQYHQDSKQSFITRLNKQYFNSDEEDFITRGDLAYFYNRTYFQFSRFFHRALKILKEDMSLIAPEDVYYVGGLDGKIHKADEFERENLMDCENAALSAFNVENKRQLHALNSYKHGILQSYYRKVKELKEEKYGIYYTYKTIKILFTRLGVDRAVESQERNAEVIEVRKKMNDYIMKVSNAQAFRKHDEDKKKDMEIVEALNLFGEDIFSDEEDEEDDFDLDDYTGKYTPSDRSLCAQLIFSDELIQITNEQEFAS